MQKIIREDTIDMNDEYCKNLSQKLIEEINKRFGEIHNNNIYAIVTYLHPKYKTKFFDELSKERIESVLLASITSQRPIDDVMQASFCNQPSTSSRQIATTSIAKFECLSMLTEMLASDSELNSDEESKHIEKRRVKLKSLLNNYIKEKRINIYEDSLMWWRNNPKYYKLYGAVRQYLYLPPSSVASERLFSNAELVDYEG